MNLIDKLLLDARVLESEKLLFQLDRLVPVLPGGWYGEPTDVQVRRPCPRPPKVKETQVTLEYKYWSKFILFILYEEYITWKLVKYAYMDRKGGEASYTVVKAGTWNETPQEILQIFHWLYTGELPGEGRPYWLRAPRVVRSL